MDSLIIISGPPARYLFSFFKILVFSDKGVFTSKLSGGLHEAKIKIKIAPIAFGTNAVRAFTDETCTFSPGLGNILPDDRR